MNYPAQYDQEHGPSDLASLLNPIDQQEATRIANARREGQAGGLSAQASTGSRIGAIESGASMLRGSTISRFNMDVASDDYQERLSDEDRAYRDTERQKTQDFQQSMKEMGYSFQSHMAEAKRGFETRQSQQGMVIGSLLSLAGGAAGTAMGGMGSGKGGSPSMDYGGGVGSLGGGAESDYAPGDTASLGF